MNVETEMKCGHINAYYSEIGSIEIISRTLKAAIIRGKNQILLYFYCE